MYVKCHETHVICALCKLFSIITYIIVINIIIKVIVAYEPRKGIKIKKKTSRQFKTVFCTHVSFSLFIMHLPKTLGSLQSFFKSLEQM